MKVRTAIFLIIGLVFLAEGASHPVNFLPEAAGILTGAALAYYGAAMTGFEQRDGRWYYRPNTWIGSIVIAIFFSRLIYRLYEVYILMGTGGLQGYQTQTGGLPNMGGYAGDPWTAGLLVVMFAYYAAYYSILLRRHKHLPEAGR
jgi:heme O synthase-like polyprenyltransferase